MPPAYGFQYVEGASGIWGDALAASSAGDFQRRFRYLGSDAGEVRSWGNLRRMPSGSR